MKLSCTNTELLIKRYIYYSYILTKFATQYCHGIRLWGTILIWNVMKGNIQYIIYDIMNEMYSSCIFININSLKWWYVISFQLVHCRQANGCCGNEQQYPCLYLWQWVKIFRIWGYHLILIINMQFLDLFTQALQVTFWNTL